MKAWMGAVLWGLASVAAYATDEPCSTYGTRVLWEKSIDRATAKAKKEGKLVLVLHISGHFEDPNKT